MAENWAAENVLPWQMFLSWTVILLQHSLFIFTFLISLGHFRFRIVLNLNKYCITNHVRKFFTSQAIISLSRRSLIRGFVLDLNYVNNRNPWVTFKREWKNQEESAVSRVWARAWCKAAGTLGIKSDSLRCCKGRIILFCIIFVYISFMVYELSRAKWRWESAFQHLGVSHTDQLDGIWSILFTQRLRCTIRNKEPR
jgi:hypothetical protein